MTDKPSVGLWMLILQQVYGSVQIEILNQAATSMLAQANQTKQLMLADPINNIFRGNYGAGTTTQKSCQFYF